METEKARERAEGVLKDVLKDIQVPEAKYAEAREHYHGVAQWLDGDGSELRAHDMLLFPQGSFAHQTAIRPINGNDYDVDVVCLLQRGYGELTPQAVKRMVGNRLLEDDSPYRDKVDPLGGSRRCWTIKYAEGKRFHLDILPARPEHDEGGVRKQGLERAIRATDKTMYEDPDPWTYSNPQGFAEWFAAAGDFALPANVLHGHRQILAEATPFPRREGLKPVRAAVQVLKRDRDVRYGKAGDKPISVIITTAVGQLCAGATSVIDALERFSDGSEIRTVVREEGRGRWVVRNPAHPRENFADKWNEDGGARAKKFFEWHENVGKIVKELAVGYRASKSGSDVHRWLGPHNAGRARQICTRWSLVGAGVTASMGARGHTGGYEPRRPPMPSAGG